LSGDEAFGMSGVGCGQHPAPRLDALLGKPVVDLVGREQAEARVVVLGVVPREEDVAEAARVLDRSEALGKLGAVLHRLELRLGEGVVVRHVGPRMGFGDREVGE
jgi:hypothetical protein